MDKIPLFDGIREYWIAKGQIEMLLVLFETKFGKVPDELKERFKSLRDYEIKQAMRDALSAKTIEEYVAKISDAQLEEKLEGQIEMLLIIFEEKFGKVPNELRECLESLKDYEQIRQAMRKAVSSETIEEYLAMK